MKRSLTLVCLLCSFAPALTAGAETPPGRYTVTSGTVVDTRTNLTWQRNLDAGSYTHAAAITYCANLVLASFSDWRLPLISELLTLVDPTRSSPAIDTAAFPSTPSDLFWASSLSVVSAGDAWDVNFTGGGSGFSNTGSNMYRVRCVR
jgi:hypothetical protein